MSEDVALKRFPQTDVATLGGTVAGQTFDQWRTRLRFDAEHTYRREHIPEYVRLEGATVRIEGDPGMYRLRFPWRNWEIELGSEAMDLDVANAIAVGRHTYRIIPPDGAAFEATLAISVRRPVVGLRDEGYVISTETMRFSHRHWLEDDRAAQRVGRYDLWLKTIPQHYADTRVVESISLNGSWRIAPLARTDMADYAAVDLDTDAWAVTDIPSVWSGDLAASDGPLWYRKRIEVPPEWAGSTVVLRFDGVDDEPIIYVNGHQTGYNCGFHRPFQVDVGEYLRFGTVNVIAICLRQRRLVGFDKGMIYGFVRDHSLVTYPDRDKPVGGIYGESTELAAVEHLGSVIFEPRIHPQFEGGLRIRFAHVDGEDAHPLAMGRGSELLYRPPILRYTDLVAGSNARASLTAIVGYDRDLICMAGAISGEIGPVEATVDVFPAKWGQPVRIEPVAGGVAITGVKTGQRLILAAGSADVIIDQDYQHDGHEQCHVVKLRIEPDDRGRFRLMIATGPEGAADLTWLGAKHDPIMVLAEPWERDVYMCAVPAKCSDAVAASIRTCKQVLTLNARLIEGEPSGLITDPIKYPVFWLRDAAISIPGSLYAGALAHRAAIITAGDVYALARDDVDKTILRPNGEMRPGQTSSDSSQLAVFAIYKAWCQKGDAWLREYYPTVVAYLHYANEVDTRFGNDADGIIRASDGDWFDFSRPGKYEREGASIFVNVMYLRALKVGTQMAQAMGDTENAERWAALYESGCSLITRPVAEGGLYLPEEGHLADTIQTISDEHPNGWNYPDDLAEVTVLSGFRPMPHCVAIAEGIITQPDLIDTVVRKIDEYDIIRPYPAAVRYPWSDFMTAEGYSGEYEECEYGVFWKCLPGCHAAGGRWAYAGGLVQLGLWRAGAEDLAREAKANQAGYLTLAHQPARVFEDAHYSGLFRNQAGDPKDVEGFYYTWGAATPLQAMVEGEYGVEPVPGGVRIDPAHCAVGDGMLNVPIAGGQVTYTRTSEREYAITLNTTEAGTLTFVTGDAEQASAASVTSGNPIDAQVKDECLVIAYEPGSTSLTIRLK